VSDEPRFTFLGKLLSFVLVAGLIGLGLYMLRQEGVLRLPGEPAATGDAPVDEEGEDAAAVAPVQVAVPQLSPPGPYVPKDGTVDVEISEYAGYAGLIAANGGLEPSEQSVFFRNGGLKVRLTISEDESWSELNEGKIGASVTTVDVLAAYGRQFHAVVPAQVGFSRGADGVVVRSEVKRINDLRGKVIATAQFTEVDFLIRFLAQEAGLQIATLGSLEARPDPTRINLIYTEDGFGAGDLFLSDVRSGANRLAGCVTWEPKVSEVVAASGGRAHVLATNRNLLVVADILVVHRGLAEQHPEMVAALVRGLLEGNRMVRDQPDAHVDVIARAFEWTPDETRAELAKVHLANLPESLAFFSGAIDAAGSFGGIYQSAVYAYGRDLIPNPVDAERFLDLRHLKALEAAGVFKDQQIAIAPIRTVTRKAVEVDPLLSKDIRFLFEPNSAVLDLQVPANLDNLATIKKLLQVSPGSTVLLRGHVDDALVSQFRSQGGEAFVRQMALKAMELSKNRAGEIRRLLLERHAVEPARIETVGRGWEEPAGTDSEQNRRVEVQWFTLE
jgi:NitT/TauT family transport system substrate-binding protein